MEEITAVSLLMQQETPEEQLHNFVPKTFDDYLGQEELKKKLGVYTQAAKMRGEALDHLLLFGPRNALLKKFYFYKLSCA